jgi:nucleotide-binding universal stress UspA family protein
VARHASAPTLLVRAGSEAGDAPLVARIVVPLDGSALATEALPVAAEMASLLGVPVHLVRVVETDMVRAAVQAGSQAAAAYARTRDELRRQAADELEAHARALLSQDLMVTTEVRTGNPATELLDVIAPTDLVVMTTHGRGGVRRWLLGSVADKLVHQAAAPVLLVRAGDPAST